MDFSSLFIRSQRNCPRRFRRDSVVTFTDSFGDSTTVTATTSGTGGPATKYYISLTTTPSGLGVFGTPITDTATLAGGNNPTGTITFYLFAPGVTPNRTDRNHVYSRTVTVHGDGTYGGFSTDSYKPTKTGTYNWVAVYSGDHNNPPNPALKSAFGEEPFPVAPGQLPGSLSGYKYLDAMDMGHKVPGDPGISGVLVTLTGTNILGQKVRLTTHTASNGFYQFLNLLPGTYYITVSPPAGFIAGSANVGSQGGIVIGPDQLQVHLGSGVHGTNNNFGELLNKGFFTGGG